MKRIIIIITLMAAILAIICYSIGRLLITVALAPEYTWPERAVSFTLLIGEFFILLHALGYTIDLVRAHFVPDPPADPLPLPFPPPEVAIIVAARHEPRDVLEDTFLSLSNLKYPAKNIYFLDDSSDENYRREAKEIAAKYNLKLFRRQERHGAKAGIINDCVKSLSEKYIAVFDADQMPMPHFLDALIPILENDAKLAFIQTPQFYSNISASRVARAAEYQQAVFYEYICEAKGSSQSMFCCGTNVVYRREALAAIGGMDETVVTEDFATSLKFHMHGWKSLYYNHVGVFGMGPENLSAYFQQQSRWAKGTIGVFKRVFKTFFTHPLRLTAGQWWEYFLSSTYYFVGAIFMALMLCPVAYLIFNVPSFFIHNDIYLSIFLPYFALTLGIFYWTMRMRHYTVRNLMLAQVLTYITFPVLTAAAVSGLLGMQGTFGITAKGRGRRLCYTSLWPQLAFLTLNFIAFIWGMNRFYYEREMALIVNSFWALYHCFIVLGIFYFNVDDAGDAPT